jgi:hypothetical protein
MRGYRRDYDDIDLRVRANGAALPLLESNGARFVFALESTESPMKIEIKSTTFVPRDVGLGIDERRLGVDIATLKVE